MASERTSKYYGDDLRPVYEVISADGKKTVKATLQHARKLKLMYSVSRILEEAASFELVEWAKDQVAKAAIEYPFNKPDKSDESIASYCAMLKGKADEFRNATADRGTEIHAAVERWIRGESVDRDDPAIDLCLRQMEDKFAEWEVIKVQAERAIGGRKWGVVGTPDIVAETPTGLKVVDMKTTDLTKFKSPYMKWLLQLGAYNLFTGELPGTEIWQCVIDRNTGECRFLKHEEPERWTKAFSCLMEYCFLANGFDPRSL